MQQPTVGCPICRLNTAQRSAHGDCIRIDCMCCGKFNLTRTAEAMTCGGPGSDLFGIGIAYRLRRMTHGAEVPTLNSDTIKRLHEMKLPQPDEIIDDLVLWIGRHVQIGAVDDIVYPKWRAILGADSEGAFNYMIDAIDRSGFFVGKKSTVASGPYSFRGVTLHPSAWKRFRELSEARVASRFGFMAMKYGDAELDDVVQSHFRPAVKSAGFELRVLNEGQPAGLIDDQLRVSIRTARFLVSDLSHGNRGAYWEAGFAEGLGRPVIYTCRKDVFENRVHEFHPHFDTGHMVTITWDPANPSEAAAKLKSTIRATLPDEARLED